MVKLPNPARGIPQLRNREYIFEKDVEIKGHLTPSARRFYLVERFNRLPQLNASISLVYNLDFEILGTSAADADVTFPATLGGVQIATHGGNNDYTVVLPHLDAGPQSAWAGTKWGNENEVIWEAVIRTGASIASILIYAGLKLTNTPTLATDDDQVYFKFDTGNSDTTWRCVYSIGGTDTDSNSGVTVAASTVYHFKIVVDSARKAHFYINEDEVLVSAALTNDVDLIPYIGVKALTAAAKNIVILSTAISRIAFESS